jgi:hypothetical protein
MSLMTTIALIAVIGILVLQLSGAVPLDGIGGAMVIGWAFIAAALAVGIHEAWTLRRGVLGWIVSIVVSFAGAFLIAPLGGMVIAILFSDGSRSLAATGGPTLAVALVMMMLVTLAGAMGALWLVNRWR